MQELKKFTGANGSTEVSLSKEGIIICRLVGSIDAQVATYAIDQTKHLAQKIQEQGKPAYLLIDASRVTEQTSEARTITRRLGHFGIKKVAVFGKINAVVLVTQYLIRSAGIAKISKIFSSENKAKEWLLQTKEIQKIQDRPNNIAALILMAICIIELIGWATQNKTLTEFTPQIAVMNPMVAVTFFALSIVLLILNQNSQKPSQKIKIFAGIIGIWLLIYSFCIWLRAGFGVDTGIDQLLFGDRLSSITLTAPRTALNFALLSIVIFAVLDGPQKKWQQYIMYITALIIFINSALICLGYAYGFTLSEATGLAPMPLTTAICFMISIYILRSLPKNPLPFFTRLINIGNNNWQSIVVFVVIFVLTGIAWQQNKIDLQNNIAVNVTQTFSKQQTALAEKVNSYNSLLFGFRSLFEASENVTADEFTLFFDSSEVEQNYPGLNGVAFVKSVPAADKKAYQEYVRQESTAMNPELKNFTIHPDSDQPTSYIITYIEPNKSYTKQALGFDLSSNSLRLETLEKARNTGNIAATSTIDVNSAVEGTAPQDNGFFMTAPVYTDILTLGTPTTEQERTDRLYGFINASFTYNELFADIFKGDFESEVQFTVTDVGTNEVIYTYNPNATNINPEVKYQNTLNVGNRNWRLSLYASDTFGSTVAERTLPYIVLFGGIMLSVLSTLSVHFVISRRAAAMSLAESMTEDLNKERNEAIAARNKNDTILASIGDAVFVIDEKEKITLFNLAAEAISGYSAEEAIGKPYKEILHFICETGKKTEVTFIQRALNGHLAHMRNHTYLIRKDGKKIAVSDSAAPLRDDRNKIIGAIIVFRDVTREAELSNAKDEFVSLASHQLRTPLSAINWFVEILMSGDAGRLNKQQTEYIQQVYNGNQRMIKLVNSLLNVSRIDLGKLINEPTPNSIKQILNSLEREMSSQITTKRLSVNTNIKSDVPPIAIDTKLLRIIIQNLLSNAVKYTSENGKIAINVRRATLADHPPHKTHSHKESILISISDTGFGIPKTQQTHIFEKLFRADNARVKDVEGSGLGLYLVQQILLRLGGNIWFESTENVGSTFYVTIPINTKSILSITKVSNT